MAVSLRTAHTRPSTLCARCSSAAASSPVVAALRTRRLISTVVLYSLAGTLSGMLYQTIARFIARPAHAGPAAATTAIPAEQIARILSGHELAAIDPLYVASPTLAVRSSWWPWPAS